MSTGGAVPNTGLTLHRLGVPVRLMGKVGDDLFGSAVLEALRARDPELAAGMVVGAGETTSYSIVISPPGVDRCFLHCSGANDTFTADDVRYDELASARLFHFGYPPIMRAMYADGGSELRRMLARARDAGPAISLDMCRPDPDGDAGRVDWRAPAGGDAPAGGRLRAEHRGAALHARPRSRTSGSTASAAPTSSTWPRCRGSPTSCSAWGPRWSPSSSASRASTSGPRRRGCGTSAIACRWTRTRGAIARSCRRASGRGASPGRPARATARSRASSPRCCAAKDRCRRRPARPRSAPSSVEAPDATSGVPPWPELAARIRAGWERHPLTLTRPDKEPA